MASSMTRSKPKIISKERRTQKNRGRMTHQRCPGLENTELLLQLASSVTVGATRRAENNVHWHEHSSRVQYCGVSQSTIKKGRMESSRVE